MNRVQRLPSISERADLVVIPLLGVGWIVRVWMRAVCPISVAQTLAWSRWVRRGECASVGSVDDMRKPSVIAFRRIVGMGMEPFKGTEQGAVAPFPRVKALSIKHDRLCSGALQGFVDVVLLRWRPPKSTRPSLVVGQDAVDRMACSFCADRVDGNHSRAANLPPRCSEPKTLPSRIAHLSNPERHGPHVRAPRDPLDRWQLRSVSHRHAFPNCSAGLRACW